MFWETWVILTKIFETLEKAWPLQKCTLVGMKIKFGVDITTTKEIVLVEVIDNDACWLDKFEPAEGQSVLSWPQKRETGGAPDDKIKLWVDCRERESSKISHCMVTVLMSSASYLGHYEMQINKVFWKYWSPCEPWLTTPTENQMKLEGLKQNMKEKAFLLYLWQQQADTVIWAPWCLVILDIQLSADLSSTILEC